MKQRGRKSAAHVAVSEFILATSDDDRLRKATAGNRARWRAIYDGIRRDMELGTASEDGIRGVEARRRLLALSDIPPALLKVWDGERRGK
jgi:hypothetical protein